jgi:hypothetical protein
MRNNQTSCGIKEKDCENMTIALSKLGIETDQQREISAK